MASATPSSACSSPESARRRLTKERVEELADDISRRGQLTREEARDAIDDALHRWRGDALRMSERASSSVTSVIRELGLVTRSEWEELELRLAQVEHRLRLVEGRPPASTPPLRAGRGRSTRRPSCLRATVRPTGNRRLPAMSARPAVRQLGRLSEIAQVAARHGFGYFFETHRLGDVITRRQREVPVDGEGSPRGQRLREMLDELGPTFVKFGQLLSTRPDVVPPDIVFELKALQDDVHPFPFAQAQAVIEEDFGL